jgi:hypothetical protein
VKGGPPKVTASEALGSIRKCTQDGVRVLGLDGFTVVPEGFRADLDLLLDVSNRPMTAAEAAAEAEAFINEHARPDVVWEVWTETT